VINKKMGKKIIFFLWMFCCVLGANASNNKKFVLVIDAGHGGHDAGAVGSISKEKDLTLRYALAFGAIVERNCPDVSVVYTRKKDVFVELWRRAEIANKAKADLFVSVHINAVARGRTARGYQTYTLGKGESGTAMDTNLDVAKRENSVILMEPNYQQIYQGYDPNSPESDIIFEFIQDNNMERSVELSKLMQRHICRSTGRQDMGAHQKNLAVLRLSAMPGCLMELGFISTPDEEQFLNSAQAVNLYTQGFYNAFMAYKKRYNEHITVPYEPDAAPRVEIPSVVPQPVPQPEPQPVPEVVPVRPEQPAQPAVPEVVPVQPAQPAQPVQPAQPEPQPEPQLVVTPVTPNTQPAAPVVPAEQNTLQAPPSTSNNTPVFKVQITANSVKLKKNAPQLKGLQDVDYYEDGGMYKYTVGASTDYNEISQLRKTLLDRFPQAFIVAFKNGKRCDLQEAIRESRKRKK
jgi:N-acetylmuramoyl-L-alanine amidase